MLRSCASSLEPCRTFCGFLCPLVLGAFAPGLSHSQRWQSASRGDIVCSFAADQLEYSRPFLVQRLARVMEPLTFAVRNGGSFRPDTSALPSSSDSITHLDTQSFGRRNPPAVDAVNFDNFNLGSWSSYQRSAYPTLHALPTELPFSAENYALSPHRLQDPSFASSQPPDYSDPIHFAQEPSSTLDSALFQEEPSFDDIFELDDPPLPTEQDLEQTGLIQAEYNRNLSSVSRNRISDEKWARYKSTIRKLYLEEGHTLSQTCKLLQEHHGFEVQ